MWIKYINKKERKTKRKRKTKKGKENKVKS